MLVIPAIDIRGGSCVRLFQGDPKQETLYSRDPVHVAKRWAGQGAERIHVIDLDGALSGTPHYLEMAVQMKKESACEIEFGGGLRDKSSAEKALSLGIDKLILGTAAILKSDWVKGILEKYPDRLMVALDCRNGFVAVDGWQAKTELTLGEALSQMESMGFREVLFTDIGRDGTLEGPNLEETREAVARTKMKVYASGGITTMVDVQSLKRIKGLAGMVIGKALYAGRISLKDCLSI